MKKLIALLLAVAMMLCFAACQTTENPGESKPQSNTQDPVQDSFSFTYKGTKIALHAPVAPILEALGEWKTYNESPSCAFDGLDKQYGYGSFYLETYPIGDKDYVYGWYFVDDMVSNDEDIIIGSSMADVDAMYGIENYNGTNAFTIKKGSGMLTIILENEVVTSIQYAIITD